MTEAIAVHVDLEGSTVLVGRLFGHRRGQTESATFTYDATYLGDPRAYALDPALPLGSAPLQTPNGLAIFGAFSDSAPDRWGRRLIMRAERDRATRSHSVARSFGELDLLLGVRDDLRQGAIRFADDRTGEWLAAEEDGIPYLLDLPRLLGASDAMERDDPDAEQLQLLLRGGSSLGGARPKAHVLDDDRRVCIAKFPSPVHDDWDVIRWEWVALELARAAGVTAARAHLVMADGRAVLVVRRFDRSAGERTAYMSAMTLLEAKDGDSRTYVEIAEAIEEVGASPGRDLPELWRRLVFGVLIRNTDDHLRNHGLLRRSGAGWSLAPAFDVNPNPGPGNRRLATGIDTGTDEASLDAALEVAELFRLTPAAAREVVREVGLATGNWRHVAGSAGCEADEVRRMEAAFEHEDAEAARRLVGSPASG